MFLRWRPFWKAGRKSGGGRKREESRVRVVVGIFIFCRMELEVPLMRSESGAGEFRGVESRFG